VTHKQSVEIRAEWPEFGKLTECVTKASGAKGKVPSFKSTSPPCRTVSTHISGF